MVNQHESPFYAEDAEACKRAHKRIVESFSDQPRLSGAYPDLPVRALAVWICVEEIPSVKEFG